MSDHLTILSIPVHSTPPVSLQQVSITMCYITVCYITSQASATHCERGVTHCTDGTCTLTISRESEAQWYIDAGTMAMTRGLEDPPKVHCPTVIAVGNRAQGESLLQLAPAGIQQTARFPKGRSERCATMVMGVTPVALPCSLPCPLLPPQSSMPPSITRSLSPPPTAAAIFFSSPSHAPSPAPPPSPFLFPVSV